MNCVENLVPFAAVVLSNKAFGHADIGSACTTYVLLRLAQAGVHCTSCSDNAVLLRATLFASGLGILGKMALDVFNSI